MVIYNFIIYQYSNSLYAGNTETQKKKKSDFPKRILPINGKTGAPLFSVQIAHLSDTNSCHTVGGLR